MKAETSILGEPRDTLYSKIAKKGCFGLFLEKMALTYNTLFGLIHLNVFSGVLVGVREGGICKHWGGQNMVTGGGVEY